VLCGTEGIGKNTFVEILGSLLGLHYAQVSTLSELTSHFNNHLKHAVLVFANEAIWGGNKKDIGLVKAMVTDRYCYIEQKYRDPFRFDNFKHLIFASNDDWPVHIDRESRRFFVLHVSKKRANDHRYFKELKEWADQGKVKSALLHDLLHMDLSDFEPRELPKSASSLQIKLLSEPNPAAYLFKVLQEGCFDVGNAQPQGTWGDVLKSSVYQDYVAWCDRSRDHIMKDAQFFTYLYKVLPSIKVVYGREENKRARKLIFQDLKQTQKEFEDSFKVTGVDWQAF
jgi:phage/plasmid-associated DNA primase